MAFRIAVKLPNESKPSYNAIKFETYDQADRHGFDLLSRWFVPESYEVEEMEGVAATHRMDEGNPLPIRIEEVGNA